jgi:hypothetical protein
MDITKALKKYILISGIGFLPLGFVVIICDSMTHAETEDSLKPRRSGTTFWVGLPVSWTQKYMWDWFFINIEQ